MFRCTKCSFGLLAKFRMKCLTFRWLLSIHVVWCNDDAIQSAVYILCWKNRRSLTRKWNASKKKRILFNAISEGQRSNRVGNTPPCQNSNEFRCYTFFVCRLEQGRRVAFHSNEHIIIRNKFAFTTRSEASNI